MNNNTMRPSTVRIIGIIVRMEREKGPQDMFKQIIAENFLNLGKETGIRVQEVERTPPKLRKIDQHPDI